jgi:Ran GTPase-activating protein (RanGAP) involved in mRNA processing and transport
MKTKKEFNAACKALGKNDPRHAQLNLAEYGALLDRKRVQQVVQALENNTCVEDLTLSDNLCVNSTLQLSHFLKTSPSLRRLEMNGKSRGTEEVDDDDDEVKDTIIKTSIVFESISRSSVLAKLTLQNIILGDDCPLEGFLSSTRTLVQLTYYQSYSRMTHQVAQAIGSGLAQNKSLVKLIWDAWEGVAFVEEVLFGLSSHISLKTLELRISLTKSASLALRSLLHCNGTLERLVLTQCAKKHEKIPTMVSVLAGLAQNTGLKEVSFKGCSGETNATLATAWTSMLERNTSMKILDLRDPYRKEHVTCELYSAVAEGLAANTTLETLYLPAVPHTEVFNGPVWQEALESNHCLKKLSFSDYSISLKGFECIALGLSCNTSLESLDLSNTDMDGSHIIALVDGLRTNKTLKCLDLSENCELGQSGRAAIERLIGYNVLRELILVNSEGSVGASILASGLSDNHSLEKLDLETAFVDGEGSETFRALCESLRGNTTLRHLDVRCNGFDLDGVCATALKLDTMSLEKLHLNENNVTSCGIAALAEGLQGPCTLKELILSSCELDDAGLLKLGEALTANNTLEVLDVQYNSFTHNGASHFFDLLPQMNGLKSVYGLVTVRNGVALTEAVGMALVGGLRENTKLQHIFSGRDERTVDSSFSSGVAREIDFYLSLNRHGRMLLRSPGGSELSSGLWPRVLAKITGPRDMSLLFYFLQNKPKIVKWNAPANLKRKASDSPSLE